MKLKDLLGLMPQDQEICIRVMRTKVKRRNGEVVSNHDRNIIRGLVREAFEEKWVDHAYLERDVEQVYSYWDEHTCGEEVIQRWSGIEIYISGMEIEKD